MSGKSSPFGRLFAAFVTASLTLALAAPAAAQSFRPEGGLWWNPAASGHGFDIAPSGGNLAVVWYTYDSSGRPVWYLAAAPLDGSTWSAPLERYSWNGAAASASSVGSISIAFSSASEGTISWNIDGVAGGEAIERYVFAHGATPDASRTGLWYDPAKAGYGLTVVTQGNQEAAVLYFYDAAGEPRWVLGSGPFSTGPVELAVNAFSGPCPSCAGAPIEASAAGSINHQFGSQSSGTFSAAVELPAPLSGRWDVAASSFTMLSDPIGTATPSTSARRIKRLRYDLDNNGVDDAVREFSYDANGRVTAETYTYTDDGTPDNSFSTVSIDIDDVSSDISYRYDAAGHLLNWSMDSDGEEDLSISYTYQGDLISTAVLTVSPSSEVTEIRAELEYSGGRLTGYDAYLNGSSDPAQSYLLKYRADGRVAELITTPIGDNHLPVASYSYRSDGTVDVILENDLTEPAYSSSYDYLYDTTGRPSGIALDGGFYLMRALFDADGTNTGIEIDDGIDGSIEAHIEIEWEAATCTRVLVWSPNALTNGYHGPGAPFLPGTGYAYAQTCEDAYF